MELFTFELGDDRFNVIVHAVGEEEIKDLEAFTESTGLFGQWERTKRTNWFGAWSSIASVAYNNIDRNTMLMLQLGLK